MFEPHIKKTSENLLSARRLSNNEAIERNNIKYLNLYGSPASVLTSTDVVTIEEKLIEVASSHHFLNLLKTGEFSDFTVIGPDNKTYKLHKFILSRSDFFNTLFRNENFVESKKQLVKLNFEDKENVFFWIVQWMYGEASKIEATKIFSVLVLSDLLQIQELVKIILNHITENLSNDVTDLLEIFKKICQHRLENNQTYFNPDGSFDSLNETNTLDKLDIYEKVYKKILKNLAKNFNLINEDYDLGFIHPTVLTELLDHNDLLAKNEYQVFKILANYCGRDRADYIKNIVSTCGCEENEQRQSTMQVTQQQQLQPQNLAQITKKKVSNFFKKESSKFINTEPLTQLHTSSNQQQYINSTYQCSQTLNDLNTLASLLHQEECIFRQDLNPTLVNVFFERIFFENMTENELKEASFNQIVPKEFVIRGLMEMVRKLKGQSSNVPLKTNSRRNSIITKKGGEFQYARNWDENGVLFYLGTQDSAHYRNPCTSGLVKVSITPTLKEGVPANILSRQPRCTYTKRSDIGKSCQLVIDLVSWELAVTHYTLRHGYSQDTAESLQSWTFSGSNDGGKTWRVISVHYNDDNLGGEYGTHTWPVGCEEWYSVFKIETMSQSGAILVISGIEFYGDLKPKSLLSMAIHTKRRSIPESEEQECENVSKSKKETITTSNNSTSKVNEVSNSLPISSNETVNDDSLHTFHPNFENFSVRKRSMSVPGNSTLKMDLSSFM
ncbi:hypothetical protein HK099_004720 [Clydaea vesicula]|uniref:BTB domain-containing protein n=1 Tax=Clydaea vesicula TaxID=447962 RepID=A0AAD5XVG1_9FUNG|nr:hypothetical protein HK099_004720 [Clydaea vesicula]